MNRFTPECPARVLAIMPHPDDFEFNAGGLFAQLRHRHGAAVQLKVITTSTGASGHHRLGPDETFHRRLGESRASAALIGAEAECLRQLDGSHVHGQVLLSQNLLGGLWNAIRAFRTDYLFCPPVARDPLAGIHVDHEETACAIRRVGYQLGVPFAYPTLGAEPLIEYRSPLIILTDDVYNAEKAYDIAVDISATFETKTAMALCHESQVFEWLPFTRRAQPPTREAFSDAFRARHSRINERFGKLDDVPREYYRISRWGCAEQPADREWLFG